MIMLHDVLVLLTSLASLVGAVHARSFVRGKLCMGTALCMVASQQVYGQSGSSSVYGGQC
jgi:hypothetical protein